MRPNNILFNTGASLPPAVVSHLVIMLFFIFGSNAASEPDEFLIEQGRRIYEEGLLPGGAPLRAIRSEGFTMEGRHAACATCHRRSGMGSVEGNINSTILVPPVAGPVLFQPARFAASFLDDAHHYVPNEAWRRALTRPAYDRQKLGSALREGMDPGGRRLLTPMPLYPLDDQALTALNAYLRQLTSATAPGVTDDRLHLATIITPDAQPGQADAVLGVLRRWSQSGRGSGSAWQLHEWRLSGQPQSWPGQLQQLYREQPVFAVLSGAGGSEWGPVHDFCEQFRVPCVLPSVELLPDTGSDYYSMYFSSGVELEAKVLAHYLRKRTEGDFSRVVQVFSNDSGRLAASRLNSQLDLEEDAILLRRYRWTSPRSALNELQDDDLLILWLRVDEIEQLATEMPAGTGVQMVFASALMATPEALSLPTAWKQTMQFVSLFDDLGLHGEIARLRLERWLEAADLVDEDNRRLQADAYAASYLFNDALGHIRDEEVRRPPVPLNREHLLETLETLVNKYNDSTDLVNTDSHVAYYGRMSLGPRQRIAVHGGTLMRYASPDSKRLTAVSKRIVP